MILSPTLTHRAAAVEADHPRAPLPGDGVSLKAAAIVDVHNLDLLILQNPSGLQQCLVHGDRPHVMKLRLDHRGRWIFPFSISTVISSALHKKIINETVFPI